ncbi:MAG: hypothetical protein AB7G17_00675 [Phycisphaerales bacterium]
MSKIGVLSACTLLVAAGAANAAITGAMWVEVPNATWSPTGTAPSADPIAGAAWSANPYRTFDLMLLGSAGDQVNGVNIGGAAADPYQINTGGGTIFNHSAGGDQRSFNLEALFSAIGFDTYATYGGNDTTNGQPFGGFAGTVNMTGAGGVIRFSSFAAAGDPAEVGANGMLRVFRVSVANFNESVGGSGSLEVGLPGGALAVFQVGPWVPTPGAAALFGLAGVAGLRRRR